MNLKEIVGSQRFENLEETSLVCWEKEKLPPESFGKSDIVVKLEL